ncbi:hypothetical protein LWI28_025961 [Acer negundo]|uniref:Uncharacterized protein n=1 Tax=Acer negundo TaxID=4023 RepID=A0AAD5IXS8_ACENE|nr:hypothetical protein LWI28_025961 [Acer negundo]KAK4847229.1 hypothetical protein QYF36_027300 [Acer negundo]
MDSRRVLVFLIVAWILVVQAMSDESKENPHGGGSEDKDERNGVVAEEADRPASSPLESSDDELKPADAPEIRRMGKHRSDKSVAGGGVIIGGLVTATFAAVVCYIRVTRRKDGHGGQ